MLFTKIFYSKPCFLQKIFIQNRAFKKNFFLQNREFKKMFFDALQKRAFDLTHF